MEPRAPSLGRVLWHRAPLLPIAAGLVAGSVLDSAHEPSSWVYGALAVTAGIVVVVRRRQADIAQHVMVFLAALAGGGLMHLARTRQVPRDSIAFDASPDGGIARVRGVVASLPRVVDDREHPFAHWVARDERTVFVLDVESVECMDGFQNRSGRIRVLVREAVLGLRERDRVELFGQVYTLKPPRNPGGPDWADYQRRQGIVASMTCLHRENVRMLSRPPAGDASRWVLALRQGARNLLAGDLVVADEPTLGLLEAMVLGHRSVLDQRVNDVFIRAGIIHFVAVSGVNVAIVMMLARSLFRALGGTVRQSTWAMIAAAILFTILTEPRPSVLRACVIGLVYGLAVLLGRARYPLNWICATIVVLAVIDPAMIFDVGYQLSTAAVIGVVFLTPVVLGAGEYLGARLGFIRPDDPLRALSREHRRSATGRFWMWEARLRALQAHLVRTFATAAAVAIAAWLAGAPIVAWHFGRVQPWGAVATLIVFPLVSLTMALGFAKLLLAMVLPTVAAWITHPMRFVEWLLVAAADFFAGLPLASAVVAPPPGWLLLLYYALLATLMIRFPRADHENQPVNTSTARTPSATTPSPAKHVTGNSAVMGIIIALCAGVVIGGVRWAAGTHDAGRLVATFLSVGAGTAVVLELPDGDTVLYDAGTSSAYDVGRHTIVPYLQSRGIRHVDTVYLSHANLDHFSGLPSVAEGVAVGSVVVNEHFPFGEQAPSQVQRLLGLLGERGVPVRFLTPEQTSWTVGDLTFERLWPPSEAAGRLDANDSSTVLRVTYAGRSILLPGDIEHAAQAELIRAGQLAADVLMLPHHGGVEPNTAAFLAAVGARALIRCHHESWAETSNGLRNLTEGMTLFNTADVGAVRVTVSIDGSIEVATFASESEDAMFRPVLKIPPRAGTK